MTGYVQNATAQPMQVAIIDPRFNAVIYSATVWSTPMSGDYAGYSQFRFSVPARPGGGVTIFGRNEYLGVVVNALRPTKGTKYPVVGTSAAGQVWSPGFSL